MKKPSPTMSKSVKKGEAKETVKRRAPRPLDISWLRAISGLLAPEWDSANDHENFDSL